MNKEQKLQILKDLPLNFPYADYDWPRALDINSRYTLATDLLDDNRAAELGAPEGYLAPMQVACWRAAKFFLQTIAVNGDPYIRVCEQLHIHKSLMSKIVNQERALTLLPETIAAIAEDYMGISAHYLMFGEQKNLRLPEVFGVLARRLEKLDKTSLKELSKQGEKAMARSDKKHPRQTEDGPHRRYTEFLQERLHQILYTNSTAALYMLGENASPRLKNILRLLFTSAVEPKTQMLMYITWEMKDWPLDFFICEHPLRRCGCYTLDENGKRHEIKNEKIVRILDILFALDEEDRRAYMSDCYAAVFSEMEL